MHFEIFAKEEFAVIFVQDVVVILGCERNILYRGKMHSEYH